MLSAHTWPQWHGDSRIGVQTLLNDLGWHDGQEYALGSTKIFIRQPTSVSSFHSSHSFFFFTFIM